MRIKYVGAKPEQTDHYYGTGKTWGPDTVHEIDDGVAPKLLQHPDVWAVAEAEAPAPPPIEPEAPPAPKGLFSLKPEGDDQRVVLVDNDTEDEIDVTDYADEDFKLLAKTHGLKVDMRLRGEKLAQAVIVAATFADEA